MPLSISITDIDNLTSSERRVLSVIAAAHGEIAFSPAKFTEAARDVGASVGTVSVMLPGTQSDTDPDDNGEVGVLAAEGVSVDCRGIPHDARVHSNPPSIKNNGEWRSKRGVDKTLLAQVEGEYLQAVKAAKLAADVLTCGTAPGAAVPPAPAAPAAPAAPVSGFAQLAAIQATKDVPALGESPVPVVAAPPAPPAPVGVVAIDPSGMGALLRLVGEAVTQGRLTQDQVSQVCAKMGVAHIGALLATPERIPQAFAEFAAIGVK